MDEWARTRITDWQSAPFEGGVAGLHDLADREFSGAVEVGSTWLLLLNGKVIYRSGGELATIDATGTRYEAPAEGLPLLLAMKASDRTTEGDYYSEETPIPEVHTSLESGGFTGYIELTENVLSGDYYVVYYGGRALPLAFVGVSERLLTGEEAFERAADEVGIYSVNAVDIHVEELPAAHEAPPTVGTTESANDEGTTAESSADAREATSPDSPPGDADSTAEQPTVPDASTADPGPASEDPPGLFRYDPDDEAGDEEGPQDAPPTESGAEPPQEPHAEPDPSKPHDPADEDRELESPSDAAETDAPQTDRSRAPAESGAAGDRAGGSTPADMVTEDQVGRRWWQDVEGPANLPPVDVDDLSTTSVPSLDPDRSRQDGGASAASSHGTDVEPEGGPEDTLDATDAEVHVDMATDRADVDAHTAETADVAVGDLAKELESLRAEVESLRGGAADDGGALPTSAEVTLSPEKALRGSHLFVRYGNQRRATLSHAASGEADRDTVSSNLLLERHTLFEAESAAVEGVAFDRFFADRLEVQVARWLAESLLFDLDAAEMRRPLTDLYEVIPRIDRVDFHESVDDIDGYRFDVVARDRLGDPLIVADVEQERTATGQEALEDLVTSATAVAEEYPELGGALLVTGSFFDPGVSELADDLTGGGIFGRGEKASYVRVARGVGFHLCLVEYRSDTPHFTVPPG